MSKSISKATPSVKNPLPETFLAESDLLVGEFERLLASELAMLMAGQVDGLEAVAVAKQQIMEKLGARESELISIFQEQPQSDEIKVLKERLIQCRSDNRNNHALVVLELKHANKSLELLRSVLDMDDLSLYSERGEVQVNREKRKLGSA